MKSFMPQGSAHKLDAVAEEPAVNDDSVDLMKGNSLVMDKNLLKLDSLNIYGTSSPQKIDETPTLNLRGKQSTSPRQEQKSKFEIKGPAPGRKKVVTIASSKSLVSATDSSQEYKPQFELIKNKLRIVKFGDKRRSKSMPQKPHNYESIDEIFEDLTSKSVDWVLNRPV